MEQDTGKKTNVILIVIFAVAAVVGLLLVAVIALGVLGPYLIKQSKVFAIDNRHYATDYDLDIGDRRARVNGTWVVEKKKDDRNTYLSIWNPGVKDEEIEYLSFVVYDSSAEANRAYKRMRDEHKEYDRDWDEGDNWFTSWLPGVCDASIIRMTCVEGNVLIFADIDVTSEWAEPYDPDEPVVSPVPNEDYFDRRELKGFIENNSSKIRDYVLGTLLGEM